MKIFTVIIFLFYIGAYTKTAEACSPSRALAQHLINELGNGQFIIVKGAYVSVENKNKQANGEQDNGRTAAQFYVEQTSDTLVKINKCYDVYEYGPFGSRCERYEIKTWIANNDNSLKQNRYLILYKDKTNGEKLVTPIFHNTGLPIEGDWVVDENTRLSQIYYSNLTDFDNFVFGKSDKIPLWSKQKTTTIQVAIKKITIPDRFPAPIQDK